MPGTEAPQYLVGYGRLRKVDVHQVLLGRLDAFTDRLRDFLRLARAKANHAGSGIPDHHQRREGHVLAALDYFGDTIDGHHLILQVVLPGVQFPLEYCHALVRSFQKP